MRSIKTNDRGDIKVADITLAQLSRGLYRSNATVFKELVNNAYDADATKVRINTNYPEFDFISCVDDGVGMQIENFVNHFSNKGIGSSTKRKGDIEYTPKYNRPIIGRLGIGMMAVGQLCHSFELESHYIDDRGNEKAFKGQIVLTDEDIPLLSEEERDSDFTGRDINVGQWKYEEIKYDSEKQGFRIYSSDVRGTFRREMRDSFDSLATKKLPFSLDKLLDILYNTRSVRDCGPYLETIWELANLCPLPYLDNEYSPVQLNKNKQVNIVDKEFIPFIESRNKDLKKYNFQLYFDGVHLKRLIQLPTHDDVDCNLYFFSFKKKVFDSNLKFSGYILSQISRAIRPSELNGIQIKLRNVGIGGHDGTFMKYYRHFETIRSKWVTGEVYVDEGLEMALNIDRDSFNEHEEHYKALQRFLHEEINKIFSETNQIATQRNRKTRESKESSLYDSLKSIVLKQSDGKYELVEEDVPESNEFVIMDKKKGRIIINSSKKAVKKKLGDRIYKLVELVYLLTTELSGDSSKRHAKFTETLKKIISELV